MAQIITSGVVAVVLIIAAVTLTVTHNDAMLVWGMLSGYLGGAGLHLGVARVNSRP